MNESRMLRLESLSETHPSIIHRAVPLIYLLPPVTDVPLTSSSMAAWHYSLHGAGHKGWTMNKRDQRIKELKDTKGSAVAERPRDALCQLF